MVRIVPFVQVQGFSTATAAGQLVGGNAAGVVLPEYCVGLSPAQKQDVAAALGFSETVFVPMIDGENVTLQFFTPEGEVDLCGHATIASMGLLHSLSRLGEATAGTLHTRGGAVRFTIEAHGPSLTGGAGSGHAHGTLAGPGRRSATGTRSPLPHVRRLTRGARAAWPCARRWSSS